MINAEESVQTAGQRQRNVIEIVSVVPTFAIGTLGSVQSASAGHTKSTAGETGTAVQIYAGKGNVKRRRKNNVCQHLQIWPVKETNNVAVKSAISTQSYVLTVPINH